MTIHQSFSSPRPWISVAQSEIVAVVNDSSCTIPWLASLTRIPSWLASFQYHHMPGSHQRTGCHHQKWWHWLIFKCIPCTRLSVHLVRCLKIIWLPHNHQFHHYCVSSQPQHHHNVLPEVPTGHCQESGWRLGTYPTSPVHPKWAIKSGIVRMSHLTKCIFSSTSRNH